ncbi:MAG: DUF6261 family protein [Prevotellaceae bacterium]|jgi:hypothetical protein|nr:DUF6261 family protein [Prevotellaceae bacterium]
MEKTMIRFHYEHLRNETHAEYHAEFTATVERYGIINLPIGTLYSGYKAKYAVEISLLDQMQKSIYTDQITAQDEKRDNVFRAFHLFVQAYALHFEQSKREYGERLALVLKNYGNIAKKTLDAETAAIDDLLRELAKPPFSDCIANLKLEEWITQLGYENEQFKNLMANRYEESGNRPNENMRSARAETDTAFRALLNALDVFINIEQGNAYQVIADNVNPIAERYKNILAQEAGMRKKETN